MTTIIHPLNFFDQFKINMHIYDYVDAIKKGYTNSEETDIISKCLLDDGCWEPFQTELMREIFETTEGLFIDIGCHLGYYSILASLFGKKVISIDGNAKYLSLFNQTITDNNLKNISIINKYLDPFTNLIPLLNFDINQPPIISLIKIDVEGFEMYVIKNLYELLKKNVIKNLIIEISPKFNHNYGDLCRSLHELNYVIYDIGLSPQRRLNNKLINHQSILDEKKINILEIDDYINHLEFNQSNFLFKLI